MSARTRWLIAGIIALRVLVFIGALLIAGRGSGLLRILVMNEAALIIAEIVWLLMLRFLPRWRERGLAVLDTRRGVLRVSLLALPMLGVIVGVAIIAIVGRSLAFGPVLVIALILGVEFTSGLVLAAFGYRLRRAIETGAAHSPSLDLILGAQVLIILLTIRLISFVTAVALGLLSLGVLAHLGLTALRSQTLPQIADAPRPADRQSSRRPRGTPAGPDP